MPSENPDDRFSEGSCSPLLLKRALALDFAGLFSSTPRAPAWRFNIGSKQSVSE